MRNLAILFSLIFVFNAKLSGQVLTGGKQEANAAMEVKDYPRAAMLFSAYLRETGDSSISLNLARSFGRIGMVDKGIDWFNIAKDQDQPFTDSDYLILAGLLLRKSRLEEAIELLTRVNQPELAELKEYALVSIRVKDQLEKLGKNYEIRPFEFNSLQVDFGFNPYQQGYIFASNRGAREEHSLKTYFTRPIETGFSTPYVINEKISSIEKQNGLFSMDSSQQKAIVSLMSEESEPHAFLHKYIQGNHLYELKYIEEEWKNMIPLPFNNEEYSASQPALSPDGNKLVFVSDQPRGMGGTDLYVVDYYEGKWGIPTLMGGKINTAANEMFPKFVTNNELIFSSDGHPGLGGLDLFKVDINQPDIIENLGAPFNSPDDDFSFQALSEDEFVIASNRNLSPENDDLFLITKKPPEVLIDSLLADTDLESKLSQVDSIKNQVLMSSTVPSEKTDNHLIKTENQFLLFEEGEALIQEEYLLLIEQIVHQLQQDNAQILLITAYADPVGSEKDNKELVQRRAKAVKSILIEKGAPLDRLVIINRLSPEYQKIDPTLSFEKQRRVNLTFQGN